MPTSIENTYDYVPKQQFIFTLIKRKKDGYLQEPPSHVEVIDSAQVVWRKLNVRWSKCGSQLVHLIYIILDGSYLLLEDLGKKNIKY